VIATGSEISAVFSEVADRMLDLFSQYSREAEVAVFVSQYSEMSSRTSSGDFSGSLLL
jgi:hypothetical protein